MTWSDGAHLTVWEWKPQSALYAPYNVPHKQLAMTVHHWPSVLQSPQEPLPREEKGMNGQWGGCLLAGCLTSKQHASVSQGRICSDNLKCCRTKTELADQTFHLTQSQYTDTGPTSPSTNPITPGAWQGSHWSANFKPLVWLDPRKSWCKRDSNPGSSTLKADALTTKLRWFRQRG